MIYKIGVQQFGRFFTLPCSAVDKYLKPTNGDFYKVLLAAMCSDVPTADTAELAARCGVSEDIAEDALLFWSGEGVISAERVGGAGDGFSMIENLGKNNAIINRESGSGGQDTFDNKISAAQIPTSAEIRTSVNETAQAQPSLKLDTPTPAKAPERRARVNYTAAELGKKRQSDPNIANLYEQVQQILGREINYTETATLIDIYEYYGFDVPSIINLISFCCEIGKPKIAYMQAVAKSLFERGITDYQQVDAEIIRMTEQNKTDSRICRALGIEGVPTKKQREYFAKWIEWGFSVEVIDLAGQRCKESKNRLDLRYTNGILRRWHDEGLMSIAAVEAQEQGFREKQQAKNSQQQNGERSYDLNKWIEESADLDYSTLELWEGD